MMTLPIALHRIRTLQLRCASQPGRPQHLSAASGLVRLRDRLYVVADDELHLAVFNASGTEPGELVRMVDGALPLEPHRRKRKKPDFESLFALSPFGPHPFGALCALGSGSKAQRCTAVLMPLEADGRLAKDFSVIDIEPLHAALAREVGEVNVEGAATTQDRLLLFQRGNKGRGINAVARFHLDVFHALLLGQTHKKLVASHVQDYELGSIGDVPLCFSDAAALADGTVVFTAIAEDTSDAYADGPSAGAAIGIIDADRKLRRLSLVEPAAKIEGIHAELRGSALELLLATDADDADVPAVLYSARIDLP